MVRYSRVWRTGCSDAIPYIDITGGCDGPIPSRNRPPDAAFVVAACWAITNGWRGQVGTTDVPSPIRSVCCATTASVVIGLEAERGAEEEAVEAERFTALRERDRVGDRPRLGPDDRQLHSQIRVQRVEDRVTSGGRHDGRSTSCGSSRSRTRCFASGSIDPEGAARPVVAERPRAGPEREVGLGQRDLEARGRTASVAP